VHPLSTHYRGTLHKNQLIRLRTLAEEAFGVPLLNLAAREPIWLPVWYW